MDRAAYGHNGKRSICHKHPVWAGRQWLWARQPAWRTMGLLEAGMEGLEAGDECYSTSS